MKVWEGLKSCIPAIILFAAGLLIVSNCSAAYLEEMTVTDKISENMSAMEKVQYDFIDNEETSIIFTFPESVASVLVGNESFQPQNGSLNVSMNCTVCSITMEYQLMNVIRKEKELVFWRTLNPPLIPDSLVYEVYLPPGFVLNEKNDPPIVPAASTITTDNKSIIVNWRDRNPELPQRFEISYNAYETIETKKITILKDVLGWSYGVFIIISFAAGAMSGFFFAKKLGKKKVQVSEIVPSSLLSPDEKVLVKLLMQKDSKVNQKELARALNWSKSKVSSILSNLEYKQMVKREKFGRNYSVELKKAIEEHAA